MDRAPIERTGKGQSMTRSAPEEMWEAARRARNEAEDFPAHPRDTYEPVATAYSRQFHKEIWTWHMELARYPALIAAIQDAMRKDRALTCDEATTITGVSPPSLGADG